MKYEVLKKHGKLIKKAFLIGNELALHFTIYIIGTGLKSIVQYQIYDDDESHLRFQCMFFLLQQLFMKSHPEKQHLAGELVPLDLAAVHWSMDLTIYIYGPCMLVCLYGQWI